MTLPDRTGSPATTVHVGDFAELVAFDPTPLPLRIARTAARQPARTAIIDGDRSVDYAQLDAASNRFAWLLHRRGIGSGRIVAVCLPRGIEAVTALLGILKAGAAYLPLDPELPPSRLAFMLQDAAVPLVLTDRPGQARIAAACGDAAPPCLAILGDDCPERDACPDRALPVEPAADDLAYVIYTSGSTGQPKGVLIEHRGICNNIDWQIRSFGFNADDRFLLWTTIAFDAALWELWTPLVVGATQVIADQETARDPRETLRLIRRERISFAQTVPAFLAALVGELEADPQPLPLRLFAVGGEALPAPVARRWLEQTGVDLLNMYGPTECTVDATWRRYTPADRDAAITIGRPIANTAVHVVDATLTPVADGLEGELLLASAGIARGYLNRPDLSAERFIANPFGKLPSDRLYRTGDRVRRRADGELEFLGRIDHQVKIRGQRIELGEIEAALQTVDGVADAMAILLTEPQRSPRLVAACRWQGDGDAPGPAQWRTLLAPHLSSAMMPERVQAWHDWPTLHNGKSDRHAIEARLREQLDTLASERPAEAPVGPLESQLAVLWSEVLGRPVTGRQDNLFALGGDSISAARILARIHAAFGQPLSMARLFAAPTIAELAAVLQHPPAPGGTSGMAAAATGEPAAAGHDAVAGDAMDLRAVPATDAQTGLWVLEQIDGASVRNHMTEVYRLSGSLDVERLRQAFDRLVRRHDALRTGFIDQDGRPAIRIAPPASVTLPVSRVTSQQLTDRIAALAAQPFDLQAPPLWRATLLQLDAQTHVLVLVLHHLIADGWSMGVLERELDLLYRHPAAALPALPSRFVEQAWRQQQPDRRQQQAADLDWWQRHLAGYQPARLGTPAAGRGHRDLATTCRRALTATQAVRLRELAADQRNTRFALLAACFELLLAEQTGQQDLTILTPTAGRDDIDTHGLVGYFVRVLPLRVRLDGNPGFDTLARRVADALQAALAHGAVGWEQIVSRTAAQDDTRPRDGEGPIRVCFTHNADALPLTLGHLQCERLAQGAPSARFDLAVDIHETAACTTIAFEARRALFDDEQLARLADRLLAIIGRVLAAPDLTVDAIVGERITPSEAAYQAWPVAAVAAVAGTAAAADSGADQPAADSADALLQRQVAGIWRDVLGLESIAPQADFFESGGHSLLAARVAARIRAGTGIDMPLKVLFDHPTLDGLCNWLQAQSRSTPASTPATDAEPFDPVGGLPARSTGSALAPLHHRQVDGPQPLAPAQAGLWFLDRMRGADSQYNIPEVMQIHGPLQVSALQKALQGIVDRHAILRTRFGEVDGIPSQWIETGLRIALPVVPAERASIDHLITAAADLPFDLTEAPMIRARLFRLAENHHLLLLVLHHIVADGWSMDLLDRELSARYAEAIGRGTADPAPAGAAAPLQFTDYIDWAASTSRARAAEQDLEWWRRHLADLTPWEWPSGMAADDAVTGPLRHPDQAGNLVLHFDDQAGARLRRFARQHATTPFIVLASAVKTLLMRYSGQTDIAVLTPTGARPRPEFEELIGCFINLAVLRTSLAGPLRFVDLLDRVRSTVAEASLHDGTSYDRVALAISALQNTAGAGTSNPHGTASRGTGPIQILVTLDERSEPPSPLVGTRCERQPLDAQTAKFDLSFSLVLDGDALSCTLEYRRGRLADEAVRRMSVHLNQLLRAALASPQQTVEHLSLIDASEAAQIAAWSATARPYPQTACIHDLVFAQASNTPQAIAVRFDGRAFSYQQLLDAAQALSGTLVEQGIGPGHRIGLCLDRSPDLLVAVLGILGAGAAYVPLDPAYPPDRLAMMALDADLSLLITEQAHQELLGEASPPVLLLDDRRSPGGLRIAMRRRGTPARPVVPADPAYMIYTSGSTGRPKGVLVPHRAVVNFLTSMAREPGLKSTDQVLALTTLSFDIAVLELLLPLTVGATIVLASREDATDGRRLRQMLDQMPIALAQATPATWRMLIEAGWQGKPGLKALIGGESLPTDLARELTARVAELWNMYGPTETTVWSTCCRVLRGEAQITVGRPIANTTIRILDNAGEPCPIGVAGEIHIGGDGVAIGYHARTELTAERFIADRFGAAGARLYRTGDRGRWLPDGRLLHMGRIDQQIKLRGHRIEPGEIEATLCSHPRVRDAVVILREDRPGDSRLLAYVVLAPSDAAEPTARDWREFLSGTLPDVMIPQQVIPLEALPRLPNGKLDRNRLPAPAQGEDSDIRPGFEAPASETEKVLAALWRDVLGVDPVGRTDDFFDLGGHSLLALRLLHRVETQFGQTLRLAALFETPTLAAMAARLDGGEPRISLGCVVPVATRGRRPPLFMVSGWGGALMTFTRLASELGPEQPFYILDTGAFDAHSGPLERIAARMREDIRRIQPDGPYQLCGFSQGGKFVHEIARQFHAEGESVHLLAFLDCDGPDYPKVRPLPSRIAQHLRVLARQDLRTNLRYIGVRLAYFLRVATGSEHNLFRCSDKDIATSAAARQMQASAEAMHAIWAAHPVAFHEEGRLLLIRAGSREQFIHLIDDDPELGWGGLFGGGITIRTLEGVTHSQVVEPEAAPALAALLNDYLLQEPMSTRPSDSQASSARRITHSLG